MAEEMEPMTAYLDNSATTRVCQAACDAAMQAMRTDYGNPSSLHGMGLAAEKQMTAARVGLAGLLGCGAGELYFTSGATESNNLAVLGLAGAYPRAGRTIVTTAVEHPSVLEPAARLEQQGYTVKRLLPGADGGIAPEAFAAAVDADTLLVSFMLVNNEVGTLFAAEQICRAVKQKSPNTFIHIDAVQGFCKVPFRLTAVKADTVSISGHKIYAPKGVGGLFVRKGVRLKPLQVGGGQEKGLRSGTESVPLIAAFGAAAAETARSMAANTAHYMELNAYLRARLGALPGAVINSRPEAVPYILNFSVPGIRSEIMLHHLERSGVYVSSGSACAKGAGSHVLAALGLPREQSDSALRVSFSPDTTTAELDALLTGLADGMARLQRVRVRK